jgi:hypothetical protein
MPITPRPPVVSPPCWCGRAPTEHGNSNRKLARDRQRDGRRDRRDGANADTAASGAGPDHEDHEYVPADGFESEAFDAW